ncbi:acyltransferase [Halopenitus malekzadehii]|uniref:acyltransferase n=1 Tax=Halopenitus malekzadehii TaxID=1267564 RepID=UPI000B898D3A|nr:acyltransferase [Halopenitus malekzadehii]
MASKSIITDCDIKSGVEIEEFSVIHNSEVGKNTHIWRFVNVYGATIGNNCMIGSLVEIQEGAKIGDRCRIQSHAFICSLVTIENDVFVSHGAKFVNDLYPPSDEWKETIVREGASIGTNATILPVEIGRNAIVGAGAVVVEDVPENAIVVGNPAEIIGYADE